MTLYLALKSEEYQGDTILKLCSTIEKAIEVAKAGKALESSQNRRVGFGIVWIDVDGDIGPWVDVN